MLHTITVDIRVLSEAILHRLELFDTIDSLWILFRKHKTGERFSKLHAAGTVSHAAEARTVPIDFPSDRVECRLRGRFSVFFRRKLVVAIFVCGIWRWRQMCIRRL